MSKYVEDRAAVVEIVIRSIRQGAKPSEVKKAVGAEHQVSASTISKWIQKVRGKPRAEWSQILATKTENIGKTEKECTPEAFKYIMEKYEETCSVKKAYLLASKIADEKGWVLPSIRTIQRRFSNQDLLRNMYDDFDV